MGCGVDMFRDIIRALRLPFLSASLLPFIFGSLIKKGNFHLTAFLLGLLAAATIHLSANLINDYADSKSGADWQDKSFYKFFGGSKLIQEQRLSEKFYLRLSVFFAVISCFCVILLVLILKSLFVLVMYLAIILFAWSYSAKPLQFSYHMFGEVIIFMLFGPALVMGGYFIQTRVFPDVESFSLSLPFGFLTTAILFANEIPDFLEDKSVNKVNWVNLLGKQRSYILYYLLICLAFLSILINLALGYLKPVALFSLVFIVFAVKAANILKEYPSDKLRLMESSKLTIATQTFVSIILIAGVLL